MALSNLMLHKVLGRLKPGMTIAAMGYPDIMAPHSALQTILGEKYEALAYLDNSEAICKRHHLPVQKVADAVSFFSLLGGKLEVYDIVAERGCEIILDLNQPHELHRQYDIVLDVGTLEHCFNIGQAALTMAGMVKQGGWIFHENPFLMTNHGFYSLNPTWYHDFYTQNWFTVEDIRFTYRPEVLPKPHPTGRFLYLQPEASIFAIAQRAELRALKFPVQTKYKRS